MLNEGLKTTEIADTRVLKVKKKLSNKISLCVSRKNLIQ